MKRILWMLAGAASIIALVLGGFGLASARADDPDGIKTARVVPTAASTSGSTAATVVGDDSSSTTTTTGASASATASPTDSGDALDELTAAQLMALGANMVAEDRCAPFIKSLVFNGKTYQVLPVGDSNKVERKYGDSVLHPLKSSDRAGVNAEITEAVCLFPFYGGHLATGMSTLKFKNGNIVELNPVLGPWTLDHTDAERALRAASFNPTITDTATAKAWAAKRADWREEANRILELFFKFQGNGVSTRTSTVNFRLLPSEIPTVGLSPYPDSRPGEEYVLTAKGSRCPEVQFAINREDMRFMLHVSCVAERTAARATASRSGGGSGGGGGGGLQPKSSDPEDYKVKTGAPAATAEGTATTATPVQTTTGTGQSASDPVGSEVNTGGGSGAGTPATGGGNTDTGAQTCVPDPGQTCPPTG